MSSTEIIILQRLKQGLVSFIDELINWNTDDEDLIATRILLQDHIPIELVMEKLIRNVKPVREKIEKREEQFFLDDPDVFSNVKDQNKVLSLKTLWKNPNFTKDDKQKVWKWMDFFLKCIDLYQQHHVEVKSDF